VFIFIKDKEAIDITIKVAKNTATASKEGNINKTLVEK